MGDAVCTFNPVYGQGMSVVALQALALRALQQHPTPDRAFFPEMARVVDVPWSMATGADLAFTGVEGHRTVQMRVLSRYLS